jgi:hypothetical protein
MRCATAIAVLCLFARGGMASQQKDVSTIEKAVEEFKVQTRNLGLRPDSPRATRRTNGGLSNYHGRLFWNFRNDVLDAVPHEVTQTGGNKGILRRNQFGFNVSGPIVIPKLYHGGRSSFVSVSYEGVRETVGRSYLRTVPTLPERSGDFSQVVDKAGDLLPIYDPRSTRLNPAFNPAAPVSMANLQYLRDPFPANRIPADRLDRVARQAVRFYPEPNTNIGPFFQNNYSIYSPETNKADGMRAKLENTLREKHRFSLGLAFSNGFASPARFFPTVANPGGPDRDFRSRSASLEHVFTASRNSINTFRFQARTSASDNAAVTDEEGIPFPVYRFSPYLSMGRSYPISRNASTGYEISDGYSARRGKHSVRMSAEWSWDQVNSYWPQYPSGRFEFSDGLTSLPGIVNTGHAFASFLLGLSQFAESSLVQHPSYFRRMRGEFQVRDEWELRQGLTVTGGLGLMINTPRMEKYDRQSTVDFDAINPANGRPGAMVFAARGGQGRVFQPNQYRPDVWVSLSWSPFESSNTVVRASWRRRHSYIPMYSGQWATQGFNGTPTYITQNAQLEPAAILENGLPPPLHPPPDLRPEVANDTIADLVDRSGRVPVYDYRSFSVERQLPWAVVLSAGLSSVRGRDVLVSNNGANPNAIPLDALVYRDLLNDEQFNRSLRPFPQYQRFDVYSAYPVGRYARDEVTIRFEKRTSAGLSLRTTYEFSKQFDDYSGREALQDYYNRRKEWALTPWASPHTLSLSYMYELPFGPNKEWFTGTDWRRYMAAGWMLSGETSYASGGPITLVPLYNNTGSVVRALYVDPVPGVDPHLDEPGPMLWFNPRAFVNPPDFAIGSLSRTHPTLRNPGSQNHDLSVTKRFSLASDRSLEFTGTAFNFINHANWNQPDAEIGSEDAPNVNAGRIIGSHGGRVIQLGLRFTF